jgi:hypothetical protein
MFSTCASASHMLNYVSIVDQLDVHSSSPLQGSPPKINAENCTIPLAESTISPPIVSPLSSATIFSENRCVRYLLRNRTIMTGDSLQGYGFGSSKRGYFHNHGRGPK